MMKRVEKGWGYELWIHNDSLYCGKLLHFNAGKKCSMHFHKLKHETFYLHSGSALIRYCHADALLNTLYSEFPASDVFETFLMKPGDKLELPTWTVHQVYAEIESDVYEFSTEHFDEDSYRLERGD
jgi:D-lyxose ketol-isomerase